MAATKTTSDHTALWLYAMCAGLSAYCYYAMTQTKVYVLPAIILVAALAVLLPPSRKRLKIRLGLKPSIALAVALFFGIALSAGYQKAKREEAAQLKLQQESAAKRAKQKTDREAEYAANKTKIIAEVEQQLASNQPREALATITRFMTVTKDPDLGRLQHRASVQVMRLDLEQNEAGLPPERLKAIYTTLIQEEPGGRDRYQAKLKAIEDKLEAQRKVQEAAAQRAAMDAKLKSQFSAWDGSHRNVEAAIKARLKDPKSYEHVETKYVVNTNSITVFTTYRARNSFNALVPGTVTATVDADGNVLSLN
ncbi:hypothetical protein [Acidovorax sp. sic0104]|uniref:hypothetical protein n=1 Tax=Acidovorax sp. sic0104 TaxID=2854784 RepID=UPI001C48FDCC|nr:hypothetical protein [Acidovorax sp. sic0104]MBV7541974.1 hypothetical protein [Acidovorax sp. sic0104]